MEGALEFVAASIASCLAEIFTLPLDTVKVRIQVDESNSGTFAVIRDMYQEEGISCFFQGLEPALLRQAFYGGLRFFLYSQFQIIVEKTFPDMSVISKKVLCAFLAGLVASGVCSPLDLVKLRMQTIHRQGPGKVYTKQDTIDKHDKKSNSRKYLGATAVETYSSTFDAFSTIWQSEGLVGLYHGVYPTMGRASMIASCEMSLYDMIKSSLMTMYLTGDTILVHVVSGLITSLFASLASNPFDMVRSRLMSQPKKSSLRYTGVMNCLTMSVQQEGLGVLWAGGVAYFLRLGPNTLLTLVFLEQLRYLLHLLVDWGRSCHLDGAL